MSSDQVLYKCFKSLFANQLFPTPLLEGQIEDIGEYLSQVSTEFKQRYEGMTNAYCVFRFYCKP